MMRLLYPLLFLKVTITHGTDIIRNRHFADDSGRTESRPQAFLQESNANRRSFENVRSFTSVDAVDGRVLTFDGNEMVASKADFTIQYNNSEANKEIELYQKFLDTDNFMLHDELEKDVHEAFGINVMENNDAKVDNVATCRKVPDRTHQPIPRGTPHGTHLRDGREVIPARRGASRADSACAHNWRTPHRTAGHVSNHSSYPAVTRDDQNRPRPGMCRSGLRNSTVSYVDAARRIVNNVRRRRTPHFF